MEARAQRVNGHKRECEFGKYAGVGFPSRVKSGRPPIDAKCQEFRLWSRFAPKKRFAHRHVHPTVFWQNRAGNSNALVFAERPVDLGALSGCLLVAHLNPAESLIGSITNNFILRPRIGHSGGLRGDARTI